MNRISPKRKATTKLGYNSTFTAKDFRSVKPRSVKSERQQWKAKAIKWFSEFIRLRDSDDEGFGTCVTCTRNTFWRKMDAGHFVSCGRESTRFDENNVHLQCKGCNKWQGGKFLQHEQAIERKYGEGTAAKIKKKALVECKRTVNDYKFIAETYKSRVDHIRQNSPGKFRD